MIRIGELFKDCGSQIICIEVKKEMPQNRSLRNAFSQTSKLALLVTINEGKIWFWANLMIILTMYLSERNFNSFQVRPQFPAVISICQSEDYNTVLLSFRKILHVSGIKKKNEFIYS